MKQFKKIWGKITSSRIFNQIIKKLPDEKTSYKFLILGILALLLGRILTLQEQLKIVSEHLNTIAKHEGIKLYDRKKMQKITLGDIFLEVPEEWDNFIENYTSSNRGIKKHFISSAGDGFALPYSSEYAFMIAIEKRNVIGNLENFLQTQTIDSDPKGSNKNFIRVNDNMFYIRREDVGTEYFKKIDNTIVVVFVYDNGDRTVDDLEQRIVNSAGAVERDTLFDYK